MLSDDEGLKEQPKPPVQVNTCPSAPISYQLYKCTPYPHACAFCDRSPSSMPMRKPCCDKESINKGAWSKQEDQKLIDYIQAHGEGSWRAIPNAAGLHRCGKSCRLRWLNYLRPDIKRGVFAQDEEDLIIKLHALLGNRWSLIAGRLPGRTDNEVKNYWNSHIRRKLIKKGIDPNNHKLHQNSPHPHFIKSNGAMDDGLSISNSCLEEEAPTVLPLNLDLTIALPSPKLALVEPTPNSVSFIKTRKMDLDLNS